MKKELKNGGKGSKKELKQNVLGYPLYPAEEDIYNQEQEETEIDPEQIIELKALNEKKKPKNKFEDDHLRNGLDVPGSELDDQQESIGSEDEENNYYSLGGDNHNSLDENNTL